MLVIDSSTRAALIALADDLTHLFYHIRQFQGVIRAAGCARSELAALTLARQWKGNLTSISDKMLDFVDSLSSICSTLPEDDYDGLKSLVPARRNYKRGKRNGEESADGREDSQ